MHKINIMKKRLLKGAWFDTLTPIYDSLCTIFGLGENYRREIIENLQLGKGKLLDVGCGTGSLVIDISKLKSEIEIHAVDPDPKILAIARKKSKGIKIKFKVAFAQKLPYPSNYFDVVVSSLAFHHMPGEEMKRKAMEEIYRVLKPKGKFLLSDFGRGKRFSLGPWLANTFEKGQENYKGMIPQMLKDAGFKNVKIISEYKFGIDMVIGNKS